MIRLLLVDDDAMVLAGLRAMLSEAEEVQIVGTARDGAEAIALADAEQPDVVLMDLRMPGMSGIDATRAIASRLDAPTVLVLTTWDTDAMIRDALAAGARGFLLKDTAPDELVDALVRAHRGDRPLAPTVAARLIDAFTADDASARDAREQLARLSKMELDVARCIAAGLRNADIAERRYMSVGNVKACVSRILLKLGLDNRVQIAMLVHQAESG